MSNVRMRANGFVNINSTNFLGIPAAMDFGNFNVNLSNPKNPLVISNLFPSTFHRLRGDIAAYSADWSNIQTNNGGTAKVPTITSIMCSLWTRTCATRSSRRAGT